MRYLACCFAATYAQKCTFFMRIASAHKSAASVVLSVRNHAAVGQLALVIIQFLVIIAYTV
jgi:hypothetical protein